jgi:excisionase family DNA binding protein
MRKSKRSISKTRIYAFQPWQDQINGIDQIVKDSGLEESIVLRKLVDEALIARQHKIANRQPGTKSSADALAETVQNLGIETSKVTEEKLSIARVAEVIGVHPATVSRLMDSGKLGYYQIGTRRLVGQNHLKQYLLLAERKAKVTAVH